jgi:uncharacterized protein
MNSSMQSKQAMTVQTILTLVVIGLAGGILSGMIGVGGGIIIVPALVLFLAFTQHQAQGTSLALLMLPVTFLAVINYYKKGYVDFRIVGVLAIGFVAGGYLGSRFALSVPQETLKKIFAVIMIIIAVKMLFFDKK